MRGVLKLAVWGSQDREYEPLAGSATVAYLKHIALLQIWHIRVTRWHSGCI